MAIRIWLILCFDLFIYKNGFRFSCDLAVFQVTSFCASYSLSVNMPFNNPKNKNFFFRSFRLRMIIKVEDGRVVGVPKNRSRFRSQDGLDARRARRLARGKGRGSPRLSLNVYEESGSRQPNDRPVLHHSLLLAP